MGQLDPNIILQAGRGVTPLDSPVDSMGKALQLQGMLQQQKTGQIQLQQLQQQMQDAQELRQTMQQAAKDGKDPLDALSKLGSPIATQTAQHIIDMRAKGVKLDADKYELATKRSAGIAQRFASAANTPGMTPDGLRSIVTQAAQNGELPPDKYQEFIQGIPNDPQLLPQWGQLQLTKAQGVAPEVLKLFTPKTDIHGNTAVTQNPMTGKVMGAEPVPGMPASEPAKELQDFNATRAKAGKPEVSIDDPAFIAWHNKIHPNMALVMGGQGGSGAGTDWTKPLSDPGREAKAQAIARGEQPMLEESMRAPGNQQVNSRAAAIAAANGKELSGKSQVGLNYKALSDFEGSGKANVTIRALNTMTEHVATARRMAAALDSGNIPLFNQLAQGLAKETGKPAPTNFDTLKEFLAGEVGSVASGGHITEGAINSAADKLRRAQSPAQMSGALDTMDEVAAGKLVALNQDFTQIPGHKGTLETKLTPATLRVFRAVQARQGSEGKGPAVSVPGLTNLHSNGTQTIGWNGKDWVDTKTGQVVK